MKTLKQISIIFIITLLLSITGCKKQYTVTFKDYDGTILKEEIVKKGESVTPPNNPYREGYIFIGWDKEYSNIKKDTIIIAQYKKQQESIEQYTVTFKDYDGTILKEEIVKKGEFATPPKDPIREGYEFIGWDKDFLNITNNTIIMAQYGKKQDIIPEYTVTFDSNGGNSINEQKVLKGDKIIEPSQPTKYGYEFDGWYINDEKWSFVGYVVTENITLEAKWILKGTKGLDYQLSSDETYYIVTGIGTSTDSEIIIPIMNNDLPVTSIGDYAFEGCTSLESIEIPNSVTSIGYGAFVNCTSLETITIPFIGATLNGTENTHFGYIFGASTDYYNDDYVPTSLKEVIVTGGTSIGDYAFEGCTSLESIEIPNSVTSIGSSAFSGCTSLTNIEIPNSVTSIGIYAFYGCTSLESIEIPNSVTSIGDYAFEGCTSLKYNMYNNAKYLGNESNLYMILVDSLNTDITECIINNNTLIIMSYAFEGCTSLEDIEIPNSVTSIGSGAFLNCTSLESIEIPNSVISIGDCAFEGCTSLENVVIGNSVTSIGEGAFWGCTSLENVVIGNSVTSIGSWAFSGCTSLESIEIPNSVTSIGLYAFECCRSLESIVVDINNKIYDSRNNCNSIIETETNTLLYGCKNTVIPNSVTSIGLYAFSGCTSLESIEIPNSVTSIGLYAFKYCRSLESIEIPNSVTSIEDYAFYYCTSLESIEIPNSVTSIGSSAFSGCTSLENAYYNGTLEDWCHIVFSELFSNPLNFAKHLYILNNKNEYFDVTNSKNEIDFVIPNYITEIGIYQFYNMAALKSVIIPNSVTSIGDSAFRDCTSLENVVIGNSVTSIGWGAFIDCTSLESIEISNSVTSIGDSAFRDCTSLENVVIGNSVTSIGKWAFDFCTSLESIEIPNSVTYIGLGAFDECTSLTIYCEATTKPSGWDIHWNYFDCPVIWGYTID